MRHTITELHKNFVGGKKFAAQKPRLAISVSCMSSHLAQIGNSAMQRPKAPPGRGFLHKHTHKSFPTYMSWNTQVNAEAGALKPTQTHPDASKWHLKYAYMHMLEGGGGGGGCFPKSTDADAGTHKQPTN